MNKAESELMQRVKESIDAAAKLAPPMREARPTGDCVAVYLLGDTHIGVRTQDTLDRIDRYAELAYDRVSAFKPSSAALMLLGDVVDGGGNIYPGQANKLDMHVTEQIRAANRHVFGMATALDKQFGLEFIAGVPGNHGRSDKNGDAEANWDRMLLDQLAIMASIYGTRMESSYGNFHMTEVAGCKLLLKHKAPVQADTPAARARYTGWMEMMGWDMMAIGHVHHWGVLTTHGKTILRNGSVCGPNDYSDELAVSDEPTQLVAIISRDNKSVPLAVIPVVLG